MFSVVSSSPRKNTNKDLVVGQEELVSFPQFHLRPLIRLDPELGQNFRHRNLHLHHGKPFTCTNITVCFTRGHKCMGMG